MTIGIRETIVTPDADGDVVQLRISDALRDDESASFVLTLSTKVGPFGTPTLVHLQRAAMRNAQEVLSELLQALAADLNTHGVAVEPGKKRN